MITEEQLEEKEKIWKKEKEILQRENKIKKEKKELKGKKITTTKLLIFFLFLNCTIIELFTCWATIQSFSLAMITGMSIDFTPLITLIGSVVGEVIGFAIYAIKSTKENTIGGIIYDSTFLNSKEQNNNNNNVG